MISGFLLACAVWSIRIGSYLSFVLDKKKRDEVDTLLTSAYVTTSDFKGKGIVRRAANWYVGYLEHSSSHKDSSIPCRLRTLAFGLSIGFVWALMLWVYLNESLSLSTLWDFFWAGNLNALLLVGSVEVALIFTIDVWLVTLIAKAVNRNQPILGHPLMAVVMSFILVVFSWSSLSGAFSALSMLGITLRDGSFPSFFLNFFWILNRWWQVLLDPIHGAMELKLQSTGRFITSGAFGFPGAIASCFFLLMILVTWITEISGTRVAGRAATVIIFAHSLWVRFTRAFPAYNIKKISRIFAAVFLVLAFWTALLDLR